MNGKSQTHQTSFLSFRYYCLIKYLLNLSRFCNNVQIMHSLRHGRNAGCNGVLPLTNMFTRYHSYPALRFIPSLQLSLEKAIIFIIHFKTISIRTFRRYTLRSYKFNDCNHSPKYSTIHILHMQNFYSSLRVQCKVTATFKFSSLRFFRISVT